MTAVVRPFQGRHSPLLEQEGYQNSIAMDNYHDSGAYQAMDMIGQSQDMFAGDYDPDSPTQAGFAYFTGDGSLGGQDSGEDPKRRRIARACDMCRKKKIKCDGAMPACKNCINYKTECIFTQVEKKRNPPKGAKYIEGLENRLGRMESLLKLSGLLGQDDEQTDLATLEKRLADKAAVAGQQPHETPTRSPGQTTANGHSERRNERQDTPSRRDRSHSGSQSPRGTRNEEDVEALSDMMCSLVTNNLGESRYIGSSSSFSIFSPKGIQWVNEKTGDDSFVRFLEHTAEGDQSQIVLDKWKPEIFGDIFGRRQFRPLPALAETLSLLRDFFDNFNCMFPLFHEPTFMHLVRRQYSQQPYEGTGWWACLNVALAIAHRLREMSNVATVDEESKAWGFMKNALGVWADLTIKNTDLLSVQALLGMALFLQGTPNPQPPFFLVGAAIRLAHSIGLHKNGAAFGLNPVEAEQRKRVFWIAYILDKDISLRSGRPPAQDDDDMNIDLPSEDPTDNVGNVPHSDGKGKTNMFRLMCTFSIIQSKVYKRLYSARAAKKTDGELLNTIGELDRELEDWRESIPPEFRADHDITVSHGPLILHIVMLHFAYYNCLTTIHRMSVHNGYWSSRLSDYAIQGLNARPLNPRVFSSAAICMAAARSSVQLVKYIPQSDHACVWMVLYYPVSAAVTLFSNILQSPEDIKARSDLRLIHNVVNFLSALSIDEETGHVKRILQVCTEFERLARLVLEKQEKDATTKRKKKPSSALGDARKGSTAASVKSEAQRKPEKRARQSSPQPSQSSGRGGTPIQTPASDGVVATPVDGGNQQNFPSATNGYAGSPLAFAAASVNGDGGSLAGGALVGVSNPLFDQTSAFPDMLGGDFTNIGANMAGVDIAMTGQEVGFGVHGSSDPSTGAQGMWNMPMNYDWPPGSVPDDWGGFTPGMDPTQNLPPGAMFGMNQMGQPQ